MDAKRASLSFLDVVRLYCRKFLRLAPMTYFIFFLTWMGISRFTEGPLWINTSSMYHQCESYWWA
jgi:hypothetical protein